MGHTDIDLPAGEAGLRSQRSVPRSPMNDTTLRNRS
jgi:hypothetical protein